MRLPSDGRQINGAKSSSKLAGPFCWSIVFMQRFRAIRPGTPASRLLVIMATSVKFQGTASRWAHFTPWFAALIAVFAATSASPAILYGTAKFVPGPTVEADGVKAMSFGQFRQALSQFTVDLIKPNSEVTNEYRRERDRLVALAKKGALTTAQALDLSVIHMRLLKPEEAINILTPLAARERNNFMLLANLAAAHDQSGQFDRALSYQQQVLDLWPRDWPGLSKAQLNWYREVETAQLKLFKKRNRENLQRAASSRQTVDDLFEDATGAVRYQNEDGTYQAGKLAGAERKKLPPLALPILQELVLAFPADTRLYWQLGELYNAQGDVSAAAAIVEECVGMRRYGATLLREHRQVLREAAAKQSTQAFEELAPSNTPAVQTPPPAGAWLPERRQIVLVGGVAGTIVVVLVYLQIRELRQRRRKSRT
jgi:tetratricopeptide (TPR) repeat protein